MMGGMFGSLKTLFKKSRFAHPESAVHHVSLIAGGTAVAQVIAILTIPIVTRIYSPADYGVMAVFASLLAILGELSGLRYYLAIPLPKHERYAHALVVLSLGVQIVYVFFLTAASLIAGEFILTKLSMRELIPYRFLIPLGLLFTGTYLVLTQWAIREKLFSTIARTRITQSIGGVITKIVLGLWSIRPLGLLLGIIVAQGGGIITLLRSLLKKKAFHRPETEDLRRVALRYRDFPLYNSLSGILNTVGRQIMPILLLYFYSPRIAGLYAISQQLLHLPATFIGKAIGQVFLQRASVARYNGGLQKLAFDAYSFLLRLGFFPVLLISLLSPLLFTFFLGEHWVEAGAYTRVLAPWIAFTFACSPAAPLYAVLDRQDIGVFFEIANLPLSIAAFWLGTLTGNPLVSVAFRSIIGFFHLSSLMLVLLMLSGNSINSYLYTTTKTILLSIAYVLPSLFAMLLGLNMDVIFAIAILSLIIHTYACYKSIALLKKEKETLL